MKNEQESTLLSGLGAKIDQLAISMEKMKVAEYVKLLEEPRRLLWINFIAGVARGLGIAIGFTILGALVLFIIRRLILLNLPLITDVLVQVIQLVKLRLGP